MVGGEIGGQRMDDVRSVGIGDIFCFVLLCCVIKCVLGGGF